MAIQDSSAEYGSSQAHDLALVHVIRALVATHPDPAALHAALNGDLLKARGGAAGPIATELRERLALLVPGFVHP
jgi:hypothetical protein